MTDLELLKEYGEGQSQQAFAELVGRHLEWVYGAAARRVHDRELAEDVAQGVFIALARRARAKSLGREQALTPWLLRVTRCAAISALRAVSRRQHHEQKAAAMRPESIFNADSETQWEEVAPLLDDQVLRLGKKDQEAILLRFYERKSLAEVGEALGLSEEAAKKRVQRAVVKLREKLSGKGVEVEAGSLGAMVLAHAVEGGGAAGLVEKVMAGIGGGAGNGTAGLIAKGAEKMMTMAKVKVAAAVLGAIIVGAVALALLLAQRVSGEAAAAVKSPVDTPATNKALKQVPTIDVLLAKLEESQKQVSRVHVRGRYQRQLMEEGTDQWNDTPFMAEGEAWIELRPQFRFRRDTNLEITDWTHGAAPYYAESSRRTWDGQRCLYRATGSVPYDGVTLRPLTKQETDRPQKERDIYDLWAMAAAMETGLPFAEQLAPEPVGEVCDMLRTLTSTDPKQTGQVSWKIDLVELPEGEQVHLRVAQAKAGKGNGRGDYWFSPSHGWMCCGHEWRRASDGKLMIKWEVEKFAGAQEAWYPARGSWTSWEVMYPGRIVKAQRTIYEADLIEVNPKAFDESMFRQ